MERATSSARAQRPRRRLGVRFPGAGPAPGRGAAGTGRLRLCAASLTGLLLLVSPAVAGADDALFEPGDHCVAYRTVKDVFFGFDAEVVGRSCEVTAELVVGQEGGGPHVVVTVPVASFDSGISMRDRTVAGLLGAKVQPDLRFVSHPIDVEALRSDLADAGFVLSGDLHMGGRAFPVEFPLEVVQAAGQRAVAGSLATTFAAFEVEVPTVAGGLIARPHEDLELVVHLDVARVKGLAEWARSEFPESPPE